MTGFFVHHTHFKIGKIVRNDYGTFLVRFFTPDGGKAIENTFSRDAFEENELQRVHLPLGTRCLLGKEPCTVERIVRYIRGMTEASYEVVLDGRNLHRVVGESELTPAEIVRLDPLSMLAGQQHEGYALFRKRESLAVAVGSLTRQVGGLRALLASRIDVRPHQAYVAGVVLDDRLRRYLLADEVGLGKTVEAGIVLQDVLSARPDAHILILCPGALTQQWLCELYAKFGNQVFTLLEFHADPQTRVSDFLWTSEGRQ